MAITACPFCKSVNVRTFVAQDEHLIDGAAVLVPAQSRACDDCGAVFGNGADMRFNARAMRAATKRARNLLTGEEVRAIRERLGLTQTKAAGLFGGGPVAFSKYESDDVAQSEGMNMLLRLIDLHPHLIDDVARIQGVALPGKNFEENTASKVKERPAKRAVTAGTAQ